MSVQEDRPQDDGFFDYGDFVEHRLNANVVGIVIGGDMFGRVYQVRLSPSLAVATFHGVELRLADDEEYRGPPAKEAPDAASNDNVIDFTKAADLRRAKTRGAA